jgi:hypothetical protein
MTPFTNYFPSNPIKHGVFSGLDANGIKKVMTLEGQPVTLELIEKHLHADPTHYKLGYLPAKEDGTPVGMLDLDSKNYLGLAPDAMHQDVQRLIDVARDYGVHVYLESSTRGGRHAYVFLSEAIPFTTMKRFLTVLAKKAISVPFEVYPKGEDASSAWYIMPYGGAANDPKRLGDTYLCTVDGEAIPYDELDEWIKHTPISTAIKLAGTVEQPTPETKTSETNYTSEAFTSLREALLNPPQSFERHDSLIAFINLARRSDCEAEMLELLKSDDVRHAWVKDGSRDAKEWCKEIERWATHQGKSGNTRGIPYLTQQGFTIPDLPKKEPIQTQSTASDDNEFTVESTNKFPVLDNAAYYGLAGEIVQTIEPHTEAHPVAVLLSLLVAVGVALGNQLHWLIGGTQHSLRFFVILIGLSSKGRKGTSWDALSFLLTEALGKDFMKQNVTTGLSSGEGLIFAVRDEITKQERDRKTKELETIVVDSGVKDKRLIVQESELGRVLKAMNREGNTLSAVLRQAWDVGEDRVLRVMTKNSVTATGAHIGIIGHITRDELLRYLEDTETANGFANRFLWAMVKRERLLPFGGSPDTETLKALAKQLAEVIAWAKEENYTTLAWSEDAAKMWTVVYPKLSNGGQGLAGAVLSRAEAQVLRLAGIYAILDKTRTVKTHHLEAALAVWEYCEASVYGVFGKKTGDTVADTILEALQKQGELSKQDIYKLFSNNVKAPRISTATELLVREGKAEIIKGEPTGGRPSDVLKLVQHG